MRIVHGFLLVLAIDAQAQRIRFEPMLSDTPLALDQALTLPDGTPVTITQFRFYVGHFALQRRGTSTPLDQNVHLIDLAEPTSLTFALGPGWGIGDSLSFLLGVDSVTNVSGAFGGDLDPVKGMYWAWNSGYINLKLEGTSPHSPYPSRAFELHLGGYLPPFASAQRVVLPALSEATCVVKVDVAPLLMAADVRTRCDVMSPGEQALRLSRSAATMFKIDATR